MFVIGQVVKPQGIHGELKVKIISSFPERFKQLDVFYLREDERQICYVEKVRVKGDFAFIKIRGVDDRTQAEHYRNNFLYVRESELFPLPDNDSYYHHQLIGMKVVNTRGESLGVIKDVENYPGNDLFVMEDEKGREHLLPASKAFIKKVDTASGLMTISEIEGLLE